jgi:hypothetical protein
MLVIVVVACSGQIKAKQLSVILAVAKQAPHLPASSPRGGARRDLGLAQLRSQLETSGFTVRQTLYDGSELAFHLERNEKRLYGLIVIRKRAISIDLFKSVHAFLECRSDSQIVIAPAHPARRLGRRARRGRA